MRYAFALSVAAGIAWASGVSAEEQRVVVPSGEWRLVGDLRVAAEDPGGPVALLLNEAGGDRRAYAGLAEALAAHGVSSLRLDLRGHGESTNAGRFTPGEQPRDPLIWDAEEDVVAALTWLAEDGRFDPARMGVVAASYSGEEAAEAGWLHGYAAAYALLSPGSFSDESIERLNGTAADWLVVATRTDRFLTDIVSELSRRSAKAEVLMLEGDGHATGLLTSRPDLAGRVAEWVEEHLRME